MAVNESEIWFFVFFMAYLKKRAEVALWAMPVRKTSVTPTQPRNNSQKYLTVNSESVVFELSRCELAEDWEQVELVVVAYSVAGEHLQDPIGHETSCPGANLQKTENKSSEWSIYISARYWRFFLNFINNGKAVFERNAKKRSEVALWAMPICKILVTPTQPTISTSVWIYTNIYLPLAGSFRDTLNEMNAGTMIMIITSMCCKVRMTKSIQLIHFSLRNDKWKLISIPFIEQILKGLLPATKLFELIDPSL